MNKTGMCEDQTEAIVLVVQRVSGTLVGDEI